MPFSERWRWRGSLYQLFFYEEWIYESGISIVTQLLLSFRLAKILWKSDSYVVKGRKRCNSAVLNFLLSIYMNSQHLQLKLKLLTFLWWILGCVLDFSYHFSLKFLMEKIEGGPQGAIWRGRMKDVPEAGSLVSFTASPLLQFPLNSFS